MTDGMYKIVIISSILSVHGMETFMNLMYDTGYEFMNANNGYMFFKKRGV